MQLLNRSKNLGSSTYYNNLYPLLNYEDLAVEIAFEPLLTRVHSIGCLVYPPRFLVILETLVNLSTDGSSFYFSLA